MGSFAKRFLDPGTSPGEVLFGLIMTLTFTLGAGLMIQEEGREGAHLLLIALIGCNIASASSMVRSTSLGSCSITAGADVWGSLYARRRASLQRQAWSQASSMSCSVA